VANRPPAANSSNSGVELNASATALSSADPVRPIDWRTLAQSHAFWNRLPVYSPALIGMEDHPGHITAADRESPALSGRRST
jgi:hypothetical protein